MNLIRNLFFITTVTLGCLLEARSKVLVVILGETRAYELTYDNIKANLIDPLNADLAVCIGVGENYPYNNPFYQNAKYRFTYEEPAEYGPAFDYAYEIISKETPPSPENQLHWREFLKIQNQYLGGIEDPSYKHPGSGGIQIFYRWFLRKNLLEKNILDEYDFFIITRSDYIYRLPHPKIELFSKNFMYIPDGEHYYGITDRHVVLPRKFVLPYLSLLNNMVSRGKEYFNKMKEFEPLNIEKFLHFALVDKNVFQYVKFFPYVMYTVRPINGTTRWAAGLYSEDHNYFIKYESEYAISEKHLQEYITEGNDPNNFYKKRIGKKRKRSQ